MTENYLSLDKFEVYKLARELSKIAWEIYSGLDWLEKKSFGSQFLEATDSTGANIAEGFGRFHYLDKAKFYFNARGSLLESRHWFDLLGERGKVNVTQTKRFLACYKNLRPALNGLINSTLAARKNENP